MPKTVKCEAAQIGAEIARCQALFDRIDMAELDLDCTPLPWRFNDGRRG